MNELEQELERTFHAVRVGEAVPPDLRRRVTRRRGRHRITRAALGGVAGVAAVAVVAGGLAVTHRTGPGPAPTPLSAAAVRWSTGRITLDKATYPGGLDPQSVVGVLDEKHVVVAGGRHDGLDAFPLLVADLKSGEAKKVANIPETVRYLPDEAGKTEGTTGPGSDGFGYTGKSYVYVKDGSIHALDVTTGQDRVIAAGTNPWDLKVGYGRIAWRSIGHGATTWVMPVAGGHRTEISGVSASDQLTLQGDRLVAYHRQGATVFNAASGAKVRSLTMRALPKWEYDAARPCGPHACTTLVVRKKGKGGVKPNGPATSEPRIVKANGKTEAIPGHPMIHRYVGSSPDGDLTGSYLPMMSGRFVVWSTGGPARNESHSFFYDTRGGRPIAVGEGEASITGDGWVVTTPQVTGGAGIYMGAEVYSSTVRMTRLPG